LHFLCSGKQFSSECNRGSARGTKVSTEQSSCGLSSPAALFVHSS
jgi:hypothetical protein